jgi:phosphoglycerol transferase MdoB-like AlkP superfamily enzyme
LPVIAILFLFKEEKRAKALFIYDLIMSMILFADTAYYRYFKDITSIGAVRNGTLLMGVLPCLPTLIKFKDLAFVIDLILLFPLMKMFAAYKKKRSFNLSKAIRAVVFVVVFAVGIVGNGKCIYRLNIDQPLLLTTMSNKIYLTKVLGNFNYHTIDLFNYVSNAIESNKPISSSTKKEISDFLGSNKAANSGTAMSGVGQGKNLIIIQVEALQQFVINRSINGQEITPNLNRWLKKSLYFDNYYYQVSAGNTSDAEFMSNNSLYPAASGSSLLQVQRKYLDSLPTELQKTGYSTNAFHG